MNNFKVIKLEDTLWNTYINSSYIYDFHHTSCFHKIEQQSNETPLLFIADTAEDFLGLPLLVRPIPDTNYFDATSVYGYGGPIASKSFAKLPQELIVFFQEQLKEYCQKENIISVFSRLHPLINQEKFFMNYGEVIDLNKTVAIDLSLPVSVQRQGYRKSNKSEINQLKKKKGYSVKKVAFDDQNSIKKFVDVYHQTMERVNAKEYYFFDVDYFTSLLNNKCFHCDLLVAIHEDQIAAGAIFTSTERIMQYHLAGTQNEYIQDTPMKLILDEARLLGSELGLSYLHLGGGVGGSDDDSLFRFKSGFSKNFFQFSVWNLILNKQAYDNLVAEKGIKASEHPDFFPLYRAR